MANSLSRTNGFSSDVLGNCSRRDSWWVTWTRADHWRRGCAAVWNLDDVHLASEILGQSTQLRHHTALRIAKAAASSYLSPHVMAPRFYLPELDGLRFVAFLLIFLRHLISLGNWPNDNVLAEFINLFEARAWVGVDIFFALSAFLITEILLRERAQRGLNPTRFWLRRIMRIWPLYYLALVLGFVVFPALDLPGAGPRFATPAWNDLMATHALPFVLLGGNWSTAFAGFPSAWIVSPLWSISIEEQFYVVWPLVLLKVPRRWLPAVLGCALILTVAYRASRVLTSPSDAGVRIYADTLARLDSLVVGASVCLLWRDRNSRLLRWLQYPAASLLAPFALIGLFVITGDVDDITSVRTVWTYLMVGLLCGLLIVGTLGNVRVTRLLSQPILVWLGRLSFGLYVFAAVSEAFARAVFPSDTLQYVALASALTVSLATLSYYVYERPWLRLKTRYSVVRTRDSGV